MAKSGEFLSVISEVTGLPLATVTDVDRKLVIAGLRSINGRGKYGTNMTSLDAARILTALLGNPRAAQSSETVILYTQTRVSQDFRDLISINSGDGSVGIEKLCDSHSFIDALVAILDNFSSNTSYLAVKRGREFSPKIEISAYQHTILGQIQIRDSQGTGEINIKYLHPTIKPSGDLVRRRLITNRTIEAVAKCLI